MSSPHSFEVPRVALRPIGPAEVPTEVEAFFFERSQLHTAPPRQGVRLDAFDNLLVATHPNGVASYVANHTKTHANNGHRKQTIYVADSLPSGKFVGFGEITLDLDTTQSYDLDKPYVSRIETKKSFRNTRQGNLLGRLAVMRKVTDELLGLPLYSDLTTRPEARRVVERLAAVGLVETLLEDNEARVRTPSAT